MPSMNNCSKDAKCIDNDGGYSCACKPGFADNSIEGKAYDCDGK